MKIQINGKFDEMWIGFTTSPQNVRRCMNGIKSDPRQKSFVVF